VTDREAFLDMLGVFAEFETNLRKERQLEGIAKAKAAGVYKGRRPSVDVSQVRALKQKGVGPSAIAKTLGSADVSSIGCSDYCLRNFPLAIRSRATI
jgi:DNA invertase Pin-like site-specific DNA recombinase